MDMVHEAKNYGVETSAGKFDWPFLKEARDSYVARLNGIYERNLANSGVQIIQGVSRTIIQTGSGAVVVNNGYHPALGIKLERTKLKKEIRTLVLQACSVYTACTLAHGCIP